MVSGLLAGLTLALVPAAEAQSSSPYTTLNIGVGSDPHGVAVDGTTDTVYAANNGSNTLSVIDGATRTVTATVDVGSFPAGVAVDQTTDTVFVSNHPGQPRRSRASAPRRERLGRSSPSRERT